MQQTLDLTSEKQRKKYIEKIRTSCKAYARFLKNKKIKSWADIPLSDKDTYFRKYTLEEKIYSDVDLSDFYMICTSSGSTGEPTLWPRDISLDDQAERGHTAYLNEHFNILSKKTLIVISFGMGTATAGVLHAKLSWEANRKGKITTITPGDDVNQTIVLVEKLKAYYDQVVFIGYPPLIREVLESAREKKIEIKEWNAKIATAGAGMTAKWRKDTATLISPTDTVELQRVVSFFGCTETGMLGMETKTVNTIINVCIENESIRKDLFGTKQLPSLVELTIPKKYVEIVNDELVLSVDQPIPLLRYNVHDQASFISLSHIKQILQKHAVTLDLETEDKTYLVVYGRKEAGFYQVEDFKVAIDELDTDAVLQEFQFKEEIKGKQSEVTLVLYQKRNLLQQEQSEIQSMLKKLLSKKRKLQLHVIWKDADEKIGFLSGKLKYYM